MNSFCRYPLSVNIAILIFIIFLSLSERIYLVQFGAGYAWKRNVNLVK